MQATFEGDVFNLLNDGAVQLTDLLQQTGSRGLGAQPVVMAKADQGHLRFGRGFQLALRFAE